MSNVNFTGGPTEHVEVSTPAGKLRGARDGQVVAFRGIRYAEPPVGRLRFRAPVPIAQWDGVCDALEFAPICPQLSASLLGGPAQPQDEDCLALNVWTPAADGGRRPVMLWIHGGGFHSGSSSEPLYTGETFAAKNVVFVSINYRVHVLGFLDLEGRAPGFEGSANNGMLDVIAALEWVQQNIAAFGGDPTNVTIFGESAGAAVVGALLAVPAAAGLFRRAICQSGTGHHTRSKAVARRATEHFCRSVGIAPHDIDALQALPIARVVEAAGRYQIGIMSVDAIEEIFGEDDALNAMPFRYSHGDAVMPQHPMEAVAAGAAAGIDLVVGANADEFRLFYLGPGSLSDGSPISPVGWHANRLGASAEDILELYRRDDPTMSDEDIRIAMCSDLWFIIPGRDLADVQARSNPNTYRYSFAWRSPVFGGKLRAAHGLEIAFVFDHLSRVQPLVGDEPPVALASEMQDRWVAFARTGDPGWPAWSADRRDVMRFDAEATVVNDPDERRAPLWAPIFGRPPEATTRRSSS